MSLAEAVLAVAAAMEKDCATGDSAISYSADSRALAAVLGYVRELRNIVKAAENNPPGTEILPTFATAEEQHRAMIERARQELRARKDSRNTELLAAGDKLLDEENMFPAAVIRLAADGPEAGRMLAVPDLPTGSRYGIAGGGSYVLGEDGQLHFEDRK